MSMLNTTKAALTLAAILAACFVASMGLVHNPLTQGLVAAEAPPPPSETQQEPPLDPSTHTLVLRGTGGAIVFSTAGHSPTLSVTEFTAEETRTWTVELDVLIKSLPRTMRKLSTGKDQ